MNVQETTIPSHSVPTNELTLGQVTIHGHEINYRIAGNGPVLLMLHGMAASSQTWNHVIPELSRNFTIVAPDMLGHGDTAKPRTEYSLGSQANMLRDLLALIGHERATFVGHSYGGGVAMQLAYQFPDLCERIVLVGSGGLGQEVNALLRALTLPGADHLLPIFCSGPLRDAGNSIAAWAARHGLRASPIAEEIWRCYSSLADPATRSAFFRTLRAVIDHEGQSVSATDRLYLTSQVPTMIVWGSDDAIIPVEHAHAAHQAIPGSRLHLFDEAGHYPHCAAPERFVTELIDFIDSTEPARHTESEWNDLLTNHRPIPNAPARSAHVG